MILVDANILIYAVAKDSVRHEHAKAWLDENLSGHFRVGLPWNSLLAFLRITTNPRVFTAPLSMTDGWRQIRRWLSSPVAWCPTPGKQHAEILQDFIENLSLKSNDIPDAHLAALAVAHGLTLMSCDDDFARYPGLRWENPIR